MATFAFTDCYVFTGSTATANGAALEVGQYGRAVNLSFTADEIDNTAFQSTARSRVGGLTDVDFSADLMFDSGTAAATAASDFASIAVGAQQPIMVAADDAAINTYAYGFRSLITNYGFGVTVGDLYVVPFGAKGVSQFFRGISLGSVTDTVSGTGTASAQYLATAGDDTDKLHATIHCTVMGATSLAVKIQSDDNSGFTSATDRITFATLTAPGAEFASEATDPTGGADDYYRVSYTVTGAGTVTFIVALGIRST